MDEVKDSFLRRILRYKAKWKVIPTIWPYKSGYGVYDPFSRCLLEHGLTLREAEQKCEELNKEK